MTRAYTKLCDRARACEDSALMLPDPALGLWERLGYFHHRRGYSLTLVRQIVAEQEAEIRQPHKDVASPELHKALNKLGQKLGRYL
jgi:hypothetical protein